MPTFSEKIASLTKEQVKTLKEGALELNKVEGNAKTIKIVGRTVAQIMTDLTEVVETLNKVDIVMPDKPVDFFNDFWTGTTSDTPPETKKKLAAAKKPTAAKKPASAKKTIERTPVSKKEKKIAEKKAAKEFARDEYGFVIGSKSNLFVKSITKKPKTMAEIKEESWNEKGNSFYDTFNALKDKGLADKDDKKRLFIVKK